MAEDDVIKPGQMFSGSYLRKTTPFQHFALAMLFGLVGMLAAKYIYNSHEGIGFMGCFGVLFYAMFNPWLFMLQADMKKYFLTSLALYVTLCIAMFGIIFLMNGENVFNQWSLKIILISSTFFYFVAFGIMRLLKLVLEDDDKL
jgi:hypothetical protein